MLKKKFNHYPFIYVGHGIARARKFMEAYILFESIPSKEQKNWIESLRPKMMSDFAEWDGKILTFGHAGFLQMAIKYHYKEVIDTESDFEEDPELPSGAQWKAFNQEVDDFTLLSHKFPPDRAF